MILAWFLALKFLKQYRSQAALTVAAVGVGVAVMLFLSTLITGLQERLIEQTLGTQPHLSIEPAEETVRPLLADGGFARNVQKPAQRVLSIFEWQRALHTLERTPRVVAAVAAARGNAFAIRGNANHPVLVTGAEPRRFQKVFPIGRYLLSGHASPSGPEALIGRGLAEKLGVVVGDRMRLSTPEGSETLLMVRGIFDLGNQGVNDTWVLTPLRSAQTLLGLSGGANVLYGKVDSIFKAEDVAEGLRGRLKLKVNSWMSINEQLLVALRSQSSSSYTIQFFVFIAVAMGIASVLVVSVVQRTREIGILRAMGMARKTIFQIFLLQGLLIGIIGSLVGAAMGFLLILGFGKFAVDPEGEPLFEMQLTVELLAFACVAATLTGMLAAAFPARRAAQLEPVEAIRHA